MGFNSGFKGLMKFQFVWDIDAVSIGIYL